MRNISVVFTLAFALGTLVACGRSPLGTEGTVARPTQPDAGLTDTAGDEICDNSVDDDGDGAIDCDDSDCREDASCQASGCPDVDLGDTLGLVWEGTTEGAGDDSTGSCGESGDAPEVSFLWRAPQSGEYAINTLEGGFDTVVYVRAGTCAGAEVACNDDALGLASLVRIVAAAGDEFVIFVDGWDSERGETGLEISFERPVDDEICDDRIDNDEDGLVDCDDPDCEGSRACEPGPSTELDCRNGLDDDGDGRVDCDDPDCFDDPACAVSREICGDGLDNDRDGRIDCADPDCFDDPLCATGSEDCDNGVDDDGDRLVDCDDPDCLFSPGCAGVEDCDNGFDDDLNGFVDCDDPACFESLDCLIDEICQNGIDDDRDGLVDCFDPDCIDEPACRRDEDCGNGFDDDRDGFVDCDDPDCGRDPLCVPASEICDNGVDDDRDGRADCDDPDCFDDPACAVSSCPRLDAGDALGIIAAGNFGEARNERGGSCGGGATPEDTIAWRAPAAGAYTATLDIEGRGPETFYILNGSCDGIESICTRTGSESFIVGPADEVIFVVEAPDDEAREWSLTVTSDAAFTESICDDGIDNDRDGRIDCLDPDCASEDVCDPDELCRNGADDDGDGLVDCEDPDCFDDPTCTITTEICDNREDDDRDGQVDCDDTDCRLDPACLTEEICFNGIDDDGDRRVDCDDPDCAASPFCETTRELCTNGVDDDGDGAVDCEDSDCVGDPDCASASCPAFDLGRSVGAGVGAGETLGGVDSATPSCAASSAPDVSFRWRAPSAGTWVIDTAGSDYDTILHVRSGTCDGVEVACDDDGIAGGGASRVTIEAARNETFILFVDGWGSSSGNFLLNVQAAAPESEAGFCADGEDNDDDGRADCEDPDCFDDPSCGALVEDCSNGRDDDFDRRIDCADSDCFDDPACGADVEICTDGEDNDDDGLVDCEDPDCAESPACFQPEVCDNGFDDDRDGAVDCDDDDCEGDPACGVPTPEICGNGIDDDGDGLADCADTDCFLDPACFFSEDCSNGVDDDGDGFIDCADPSCIFDPACESGEICDNGRDDDGDGLIDCNDPECLIEPVCIDTEDCSNGIDDDGDGAIDCDDLTCLLEPECQIAEDCSNGVDDDGDGDTDCDDTECASLPLCATSLCPNDDLGEALGSAIAAGSTTGASNDIGGSCGGASAEDVAFTWTAPSNGRYAFDTQGSDFETALYVLDGEACDPDLELVCQTGEAAEVFVNVGRGDTLTVVIDGTSTRAGAFVLNARRIPRREIGLCANGIDDDEDGAADCDDGDCSADPACVREEVCDNGEDDDGDGLADCDDPSCEGDPACASVEICDNGVDDDGDRRADCFDPDCFDDPACVEPEDCDNGFDDDGDGLADCDDPDCASDPDCLDTCPDEDLGEAIGAPVAEGTTEGRGDNVNGSCSGGSGPDVSYTWRAPRNGRYQFDTQGSSFDTQLHIRLASCDGEELVCNDDTGGFQSTVQLPLVAGAEVVIFVDGFGGSSAGDYVLNISEILTTEVGACTDGVDNDSDGEIDCDDPDCDDDVACIVDEVCFNDFDDDRDGLVDCDDPDCDGFPTCGSPEVCDNGVDDDLDGAVDCDDPSCDGDPACIDCPDVSLDGVLGEAIAEGAIGAFGNRDEGSCGGAGDDVTVVWVAPANGRYRVSLDAEFAHALYLRRNGCGGAELECTASELASSLVFNARGGSAIAIVVDALSARVPDDAQFILSITPAPSDEVGLCDNGIDDDDDGFADCEDTDCEGDPACSSSEDCGNGIDDDGDERIDCEDVDCAGDPRCVTEEERCDNGFDDDGDGNIDCADTECVFTPECFSGGSEDCGNGIDDDDDGAIDCADPSCSVAPECFAEENCRNGIDDDGDGQVDCDDLTCAFRPFCQSSSTEDCGNGIDDDDDGAIDCDDTNCVFTFECIDFPFPFP